MRTSPPIILIVGPTAGGKTELAIELAARLPGCGECICADSMQVYRGMDIGTAKPTPQERARAPHHLIDIVEPSEGFTVDEWLKGAEEAVEAIRGRQRWPIVVGGTNLYVKALLEGLFEGPQPDVGLRSRLGARSNEALHDELRRIDPAAAERIHPNDRRRTIRAIEVHRQTGRPISEHQQQWDVGRVRDDVLIIGIDYPVDVINRRINARVRRMIEGGLIEEVQTLDRADRLGRQAREALGYKQILEHLKGDCTRDEAIEQIKIRTRRFAKQQRTWLRRFRTYPRSLWLKVEEDLADDHLHRALEWILENAGAGTSATQSHTG